MRHINKPPHARTIFRPAVGLGVLQLSAAKEMIR